MIFRSKENEMPIQLHFSRMNGSKCVCYALELQKSPQADDQPDSQ